MKEETRSEGDSIDCPYCGLNLTDLYEFGLGDYDNEEVECDCGESFLLICYVTVSYVARPLT